MMEVRVINENEIDEVAQLEQQCFPDPWSARSIQETYQQKNALILGGWKNDEMIGYVIFYYVLDVFDIERIAVAPSCRRTGAATEVFRGLLKVCEEKEITRIMLDVRESNVPAITFYRKCGFAEDGVRKSFYTNPTENAVLMSMDVGK